MRQNLTELWRHQVTVPEMSHRSSQCWYVRAMCNEKQVTGVRQFSLSLKVVNRRMLEFKQHWVGGGGYEPNS